MPTPIRYREECTAKAKWDKEQDRIKNDEKLEDFFGQMERSTAKRKEQANVYKKFWDEQCQTLASDRQSAKEFNKLVQVKTVNQFAIENESKTLIETLSRFIIIFVCRKLK